MAKAAVKTVTIKVPVVASVDQGDAAASDAPGEAEFTTKSTMDKLAVDATVVAPSKPAAKAAASLATAAAADEASSDATADPSTVASDDGEGGAVEAKAPAKPAKVESVSVVKAALAAAADEATPSVEAPASTRPAKLASAEVDTSSQSEDATANTHLASLTVPANPAPTGNCKVFTASYGGGMALLIKSQDAGRTRLTALTVNEAKADSQAKAFINVYAKGGVKIAQFGTQNEALTKAFQLCPEG